MVEKIIVNPNEIRGYGNVLTEKNISDFLNYECFISKSTDTVNGAVEPIFIIEDVFGSIYYDQCNNTSKLENYGNSVYVLGVSAVASLTYDDTVETYKLSGNGNSMAMIPITSLNDMDGYTIEADFKAQNIQNDKVGFCLRNRNDNLATQQCFYFSIYDGKFTEAHFVSQDFNYSHQDTTVDITDDKWYHMKMSFENGVFTGELYDEDTLLASSSNTLQVDNKQIGLLLDCRNSTSDNAAYVKNIKVTPYTAPVSSYTLEFSQSTYEDSFGMGVNIYATLKDNGTAMSGETVTFSYTMSGIPTSQTAVTNSSGVATIKVYGDFVDYVVTASYQTASATCTISGGGGDILD